MFSKSKTEKSPKTVVGNMQIDTVIAEGITVTGDLAGDGAIRIDGRVEGNLELSKGIILGEKAEIVGRLKSADIIIYGKLTGDLECRDLYIMESGRIEGNLTVNRFSVEMGGKYTGNLKMTDNEINLKEKLQEKKMNNSAVGREKVNS